MRIALAQFNVYVMWSVLMSVWLQVNECLSHCEAGFQLPNSESLFWLPGLALLANFGVGPFFKRSSRHFLLLWNPNCPYRAGSYLLVCCSMQSGRILPVFLKRWQTSHCRRQQPSWYSPHSEPQISLPLPCSQQILVWTIFWAYLTLFLYHPL